MGKRHDYFLLLAVVNLQFALLLVDGAPLPYSDAGETVGGLYLSLVVSLVTLVALVVLLINCTTCCKEEEIDFKEFEDNFEDEIDFTPPAEDTPSIQSPAEVYTLTVPPLALPGPPRLQLSGAAEGAVACQLARHNLSYIQEVGNGWFGKVLLSELHTDSVTARLVVKELKANSSAKEQNDFLQQGDPYRVLQHPNILHCLGQCVEAIPFLLVFEYCELGDLKSYLAQQDWIFRNAEKLQLQKMACEIAAGVTHLHKHNFLHSDLALRNCFLTMDLTVKVGDYGIGSWRYKDDYITTEEETEVALRWMAPELLGELHGNVITAEQTKPGNVWALGVTLWELFENATQPYPHLSDREVLVHVIKEQQVKLLQPQLELPYSDRWYEVLQFCWLPPDKRATAEEVHRLLTYLRMQGQRQSEEDFQQRWDALKPNPAARQATASHSSFPILEQFGDERMNREVDEVLTVTETSRGLSFEYVWEAAKHDHYDSHGRSSADTTLNYRSMFFPAPRYDAKSLFPGSGADKRADNGTFGVPGILPVFDAHEPAAGNEYYIQLEEQGESLLEVEENSGLVDSLEDPGDQATPGQYMVLRDIPLEESSTDLDFFDRSVDSKGSYPQESQAWSSTDTDSPYHSNIFSESGSKREDSDSWGKGFLELPELNGGGLQKGAPSEGRPPGSFIGGDLETSYPGQTEEPDGMPDLTTENLTSNFLFLQENNLMKEDCDLSEKNKYLDRSGIGVDLDCDPKTELTRVSGDGVEIASAGKAGSPVKSVDGSVSLTEERLDFISADLTGYPQPLMGIETRVPLSTLVAEDGCSNQLHLRNGSPNEEHVPVRSSESGIGFTLESTSKCVDVSVGPSCSLKSATKDISCTDAKTPSLGESLGTSWEVECATGIGDHAKQPGLAPPHVSQGAPPHVSQAAHVGDFTAGLISDSSVSGTVKDIKNNMNIVFSELPQVTDCILERSFVSFENNDLSTDTSSLLVSDCGLHKTSQDSLLDSSLSSSLLTGELSAETPDSLASLDVSPVDSAAPQKLQPPYKTADSGYETENLESPEWNSQSVVRCTTLEDDSQSGPAQPFLPEIVISKVDSEPEVWEDGTTPGPQPGPELLAGGSQNYRDSAYFSDNESEVEKKAEEKGGENLGDASLWARSSPVAHEGDAPLPQDITVESAEAAEDGRAEPPKPVLFRGNSVPELVLTTEEDWDKKVPVSIDGHQEAEALEVPDRSWAVPPPSTAVSEPPTNGTPLSTPATPAADKMVHAKLVRTHAGEALRLKEPDVEGRFLGKRDGVSPAGGLEDGMEADEEDEDSDGSDDDMRAYHLHTSSSDSEDDDAAAAAHPVPLIITDDSHACNLKSLLKTPSSQTDMFSPPEGNSVKRKAISFFDDVTVYLFDQETPTKELGDHALGSNSHVSEFCSPVPSASYLNKFTTSEGSTDEEGGGFEWDDDFSCPEPSFISKATGNLTASRPPASAALRFFSPPPPGRAPEPGWASPPSYSRFSISPANIASFSLTHLTDSDTEQGGSSEDGEKD